MREKSPLAWLLVAVILIIVVNLPISVSRRVKGVFREALAPLQTSLSSLGRRWSAGLQALRGLDDLAEENRRMAAELVYLRNQVRELRSLESENRELRKQLDFTHRVERRLLPCEVIGRDPSGWWNAVRINRGAADGVRADMAVITADGVAGRTLNTSIRTADVLLISDPNCKVSARLPRTGAFGIVSGTGEVRGGRVACVMDFINKDLPVLEGDEVVTSGLGGVFPRGLLIGYVEKIYRDSSGLYQRADIVPKADLGRLTYVFVVLEEGAEIEEYLRARRTEGETP